MKYVITLIVLFAPLALFAEEAPESFANITLFGNDPVEIYQGKAYVEPGYEAFSTEDGDITDNVQTTDVDNQTIGNHEVHYSVEDSVENRAEARRGVTVKAAGGMQLFCSSPTAPGWNVSLPNGGCGVTSAFGFAGNSIDTASQTYVWQGRVYDVNTGQVVR